MRRSVWLLAMFVLMPFALCSQSNSWDGKGIANDAYIKILNVFINVIYDVHPEENAVETQTDWPSVTDAALAGVNNASIPGYLLDFFDTVYVSGQLHGCITRLYGESSFDSLQLTGDAVVVNVLESSVISDTTPVDNIRCDCLFCYNKVIKVAMEMVGDADSPLLFSGDLNISSFDKNGNGKIDYVNFLIRNITKSYGGLNAGSGLGNLNPESDYKFIAGDDTLEFDNGTIQCVGSGNISNNPTNIVVHEISHGLFGSNDFHTSGGNHRGDGAAMSFINVQGGYGLMGAANSGLVGCNGYERWRMHWKHPLAPDYITARNAQNTSFLSSDITKEDGEQTFLLRDFVTTGDAVRIKLPYKDSEYASNQYIWLENHQVGFNDKLDFLQYSNENSCRPQGAAGIYSYYQVGRDILTGPSSEVWFPTERDNLKIISAEGFWDYTKTIDSSGYAFGCVAYNTQHHIAHRDTPNPFCGYNDQELMIFPQEGSSILAVSDEISMARKMIGNNVIDSLSFLGDGRDAFSSHVKIGMGTNPSTCNTKTYYVNNNNSNGFFTLPRHEKRKTQTTYLTGLSIEMTPLANHDFLVHIRWDDYDIVNDARWTGRITLKERAVLKSDHTVTLAQNRTVAQYTRDVESQCFAKTTHLTCEGGSFFCQEGTSRMLLTEKSRLTLDSGSHYLLLDNASISVQEGCTLTAKQGARFEFMNSSTLIVEPGGTVLLSDSAVFSDSARIIVRPGGKLVVDGGTLTSSCDGEMWQGIVVEGDAAMLQVAPVQGSVELRNGAVIENARCGLMVGNPGDTHFSTSGGMVTAQDAHFRNCLRAVEYRPYTYLTPSGAASNCGSFTRCLFTVDNAAAFETVYEHTPSLVRLWGVNGIDFKGCTFANTTGSRGYGIRAEDAGFNIDTYCPGGIFLTDCTCEPSDATYSTFQGFDKAVEANTTGNQFAVRINQACFTGNGTGVSINGNNYTTVTRCDFDLTQVPLFCTAATGLRLSGCTGFLVEGNSFHRTTGVTPSSTNGISVADAGISANSIYRNQFSNLANGIYITGTNGTKARGLSVTCGVFSGNARDIYLAAGATVARNFGSSLMGADNDFSHTSTSSISCAGIQNLNYYYSPATSHVPYNPSFSVTTYATATANGCQSTLCDNGPMQLPRDLSSADTHSPLSDNHGNAALSADRNIRLAMADTVLDLDLLADWYDMVSEPSAKYSLAETHFQQNTDNTSVFSTIETEYLATDEDKAEYDNYRAFDALKKALVLSSDNQSSDWSAATPGQIAELQRIAEARTGRSSVMAQGVLCFFFDLCSDDFLESEQTTDTRSAEAPSVQPSGDGLVVSPNPTEGVLRVEGDGDIASVELYDTFGRLLLTRQCDGPLCILDIAGLNDGAYLLKVRFANGTVSSCKVVKK